MDLVQIQKKLNSENTFVYLANDVYQGTGPEFFLENYHIVTFDYNPLTRLVRNNTKVFTLEEATNVKNKTFRNSSNLADFSCVVDYVNSLYGNKKVLTFKNSAHLKSCAINNKWEICASNPELGRYFENKLKSGKYFEELSLNVPAYKIIKAGKDSINYKSISREFGEKFVIQLAKGFGGAHTYIISSETDIQDILPRISEREVKISKFIEGLTITINACVTSTKVIAAHPFLQITGIEECIKNKSGATGNQWGDLPCPNDLIIKSTIKIGEYMQKAGYRGIFGLDILVAPDSKVYFIENNARMVNSIPFFTQLQINKNEIPLFAIHLLEFIGKSDKLMEFENLSGDYGNNLKGAQIVMHNLENNAIEIRKDLKPGVYKFVNKILTFDYESYEISSCRAADEFLILPKEIGRFVNSGMEIARVQSPFNLVNDKGALLPFTRDIIKQLYKQLVHSSQIH